MEAFHSFWSKPVRIKKDNHVEIPDYEFLALMLSALKWKQLNGPIKMITDTEGAKFFAINGLENLWSEPIDTSLDGISSSIDPFLFWAAGKLYALSGMPCPCVMLDTDMIIWQNLSDLFQRDVIAAHTESLSSPVYPNPDVFQMRAEYAFPHEWDFSVDPINTAFLYMPEADLKDYYVQSAFSFMNSLEHADVNPAISMCFAEQRILPMCIEARRGHITCLFDNRDMFSQRLATHLWGYKRVLSESSVERELFCVKCVKRILQEFPEWEPLLARNTYTHRYFAKYKSGLTMR